MNEEFEAGAEPLSHDTVSDMETDARPNAVAS
jgi:hypothetical protein